MTDYSEANKVNYFNWNTFLLSYVLHFHFNVIGSCDVIGRTVRVFFLPGDGVLGH